MVETCILTNLGECEGGGVFADSIVFKQQLKKSLIPITKSHQKHRLENTQIYTTMSVGKESS